MVRVVAKADFGGGSCDRLNGHKRRPKTTSRAPEAPKLLVEDVRASFAPLRESQ
jgi:hypothetical protein